MFFSSLRSTWQPPHARSTGDSQDATRTQDPRQTTVSCRTMMLLFSSLSLQSQTTSIIHSLNVTNHLPELLFILDAPNLPTLVNQKAGRVGSAGLRLRRRGRQLNWVHTSMGASNPPLRQPAKSEHNFLREATSSGVMIHSRALTEAGRTHNHWRSMQRPTPQLRPDTVSRRGAPDADGSAAPPGVYLLPRGGSPLAGRPSLATSWSSSIGNLLNRNTIPSVEPRASGVTIHNRASTEYMDENVTFGFADASDTRASGGRTL